MSKPTAKQLIDKIKFLRSQGYSFPEISQEIGVSKTTVFRYSHTVEVLPQFRQALIAKRGGSQKIKLLKEQLALEEAKKIVASISYKEKLLFISALYWGEGSKNDFGLSNTDPDLIRVFVAGLRDVLKISDERLSISIRIYEDLDKDECLTFWSKIVGIPKEKFVSVNVLTGKKSGKLPYGMCRVRVRKGRDLLKKLVGINKIVAQILPP